jgi:drug/metabolite transporter (DMT)-like permease
VSDPDGDRPANAPPDSSRRDLIGAGLGIAMGVLFSVVVILGKGLLHGRPPFALLFFRFGVTACALAVVAILTGRPLVAETGERLGLIVAATLGYGTESALYFAALNHGSAATVTLLFYTYPVWVMITAIALDRRVPAAMLIAALGLAIVGSAIVVAGGSGVDIEPAGIVLALLCALVYTGYLIGADRVVRRTNPLTTATWLAAGASLANLTYAFVFHGWSTPIGPQAALRVVGMGVFTAGAFVCMIASLQRIGAVRNAILGVIEPLMVAVLAAAFLSEPITTSVAAGGALILVAGVIATVARGARVVEPDL